MKVSPERRRVVSESSVLARIAWPLALAQLFHAGMGMLDTYFLSKMGAEQIAGAGLAVQCFYLISVFMSGLLSVVGIRLAHQKGREDNEGVKQTFFTTICFAIFLGLIFSFLLYLTPFLLERFHQSPITISGARHYVLPLLLATFPNVLWMAFRYFLSVEVRTTVLAWSNCCGLITNFVGNYYLGAMYGIQGIALATSISYWFMLCLSFVFLYPYLSFSLSGLNKSCIKEFLRIGFPVACAAICDTGFFLAVTLMIGSLGEIALASHLIALQFLYLPFMIPYSFGIATSIRVAYYDGKQDRTKLNVVIGLGMISALIPIVLLSCLYSVFPTQCLSFFDKSSFEIFDTAANLLNKVALFQIVNAAQVILMSALRGLKDTKMPFYINVSCYWIIGIPLCLYFSKVKALESVGVWSGMILAQCFLVIFLFHRWLRLMVLIKKNIKHVSV